MILFQGNLLKSIFFFIIIIIDLFYNWLLALSN